MIIKRLTMHNFGVYAGTNTFSFSGSKPIVLIGGLNGRGKTTFLEAVLLALYGANSFAYKESSYKTYGQYLRSYVNRNDLSNETYVEMEFQLSANDVDLYLVRREWSAVHVRTYETVCVKQNGIDSSFLTQNWSMFMENILPSSLSNFFFFDGEKIAELAVDDTDAQMKESIRSMLGLSSLDVLGNDINRVINRINKTKTDQKEINELQSLKETKELAQKRLSDIDQQIENTNAEINILKTTIEQTKIEYTSKGGDIVEHRQDLFQKRAELVAKSEVIKVSLVEEAASELPFALVKRWLNQIGTQTKKESNEKQLRQAVSVINKIYKEYSNDVGDEAANKLIDFIKSKMSNDTTDVIYDLSDSATSQLNNLLNSGIGEQVKITKTLENSCNSVQKEINEIDSFLSVDINENALRRLYKKIKQQEQKQIDMEVKLDSLVAKRTTLNGDFMKSNSEFNRYADDVLGKMEAHDDADRTVKYASMAEKILNEYTIRLQKSKVKILANSITECYKLLANKKTLIDHINMDSGTLDLHYIGQDGRDVPKEKLSAGEKQLMVISILWALAKCSKKKLPVIIDTPLSRLDSTHRKALIKTYFPNASEQTIILSTDTEIDNNYYQMMKKDIGDEFCLNYDETTKSTTISSGYFNKETA